METNVFNLDEMVPKQIVNELNKYVIGQDKAKKTIAVAIRNRTRRKKLPKEIIDEVFPKNIIMIGPTGVGKTEIARRIARMSSAPFVKVEATKYTEVGYVGRDVESMIRDLMGIAVSMVKKELAATNEEQVQKNVDNRLLDAIVPNLPVDPNKTNQEFHLAQASTRERFREMLKKGDLDDKEIEISVSAKPRGVGIEMMSGSIDDIQNAVNSLGSIFANAGKPGKKRKTTVKHAREIFAEEEREKVIDQDKAVEIAKERTEQMGIVFIDEIDKIAGKTGGSGSGSPDVSREGVQRDILPIVEGSKISTKWGIVDTSHILFIAAGAFHVSKPSDLIPELQGRFPLRVELDDLTDKDFFRILKEPENAITKQYHELLKTEGVSVEFTDESLKRISEIAYEVNSTNENIGARRLYTVMEILLEELSFSADELKGQKIEITPGYVDERLKDIVTDQDMSRYIL